MSFSQPSSAEAFEPTVEQTEHLLNAINGALQQLQEDVITQLNDDVTWLRAEKASLLQDIAQLRQQRQQMLTETQLAQQQQWAQEFAKILARYLQQNLQQQLQEDIQRIVQQHSLISGDLDQSRAGQGTLSDRDWQRLQSILEHTVEYTVDRAFRQYAQQVDPLPSPNPQPTSAVVRPQQQDWETSDQSEPGLPRSRPLTSPDLGVPAAHSPTTQSPAAHSPTTQSPAAHSPTTQSPTAHSPTTQSLTAHSPTAYNSTAHSPTAHSRSQAPAFQWHRQGIALAVLSMLMLSLQYVLAQALFQFPADSNFNAVQDLELQASWTNTALLVGLRMLVFLPLITVFNRWLQPNLGNAVQGLFQRSKLHRQLWWNIGLSGLFLFLSQLFLFRVVGLTSAGLAVGLFFIYPGLVPLFHWGLAGDRPSQFRIQCILALGVGATLIFSQPSLARSATENLSLGSVLPWGMASAICFTLYLLISDRCNQRLNPSVVSLVQYSFVILFSLPALLNFEQISILQLTNIGLGGLVLGGTAALSYILHVFAVQIMGAVPAMILNSLTPLLTAILGFILLQSPLAVAHGLGVLLITIGGIAIQMERLRPQA